MEHLACGWSKLREAGSVNKMLDFQNPGPQNVVNECLVNYIDHKLM